MHQNRRIGATPFLAVQAHFAFRIERLRERERTTLYWPSTIIILSKAMTVSDVGDGIFSKSSISANRDSFLRVLNTSARAGVPQGSTLSPLLYFVYTNDILRLQTGVQLSLFAGDMTSYKSHSPTASLCRSVASDKADDSTIADFGSQYQASEVFWSVKAGHTPRTRGIKGLSSAPERDIDVPGRKRRSRHRPAHGPRGPHTYCAVLFASTRSYVRSP
ncbi:hypothetical protein EVAR_82427_1 [Eumeta japonica]|uniref:RNA-directed DNA polymerase from transposon BS n=1 Tax=Eumeta variegata TaxID=151549 RepID=A0A4C1YK60_EUMVA|nr:hypothetical protein EVAR_82427_1 [Eumeta japonica]